MKRIHGIEVNTIPICLPRIW